MSGVMQSGSNGQCAIYGCPLAGSLGRGDEWVCYCHYGAAADDLQAITQVLRQNRAIGESTVDIRLFYGTDHWPSAYRGIQRRLLDAGLPDMLPGEADRAPDRPGGPVVKQWLARLEGYLLHACDAVRSARNSRHAPRLVPTAPVIGPTHIAGSLPYTDTQPALREE
ncbi:hypothetical protein [Paraburkholderia sp. BR14320]|uniref:hypothetical protein n=1 Tax=unclassified Paraburkholderia TaxID=2615204 RepID=UPI0034CE05ED